MAVKIRLKRMGKKKQPTYRVVVADGRSPRDGRFIEAIGRYDPRQDPSVVEIDNEKALDWLHKGAQPTDPVRKLLEISGAWSLYKVSKGEIHTVPTRSAPDEPKTKPEPISEVAKPEPISEVAKPEPISEVVKPEPISEVVKPEPISEVVEDVVEDVTAEAVEKTEEVAAETVETVETEETST